jgi:predicted ArsR family transcriptional regulator
MTQPATDPRDPIGALAEPVRRRLYDFVVAAREPVDRDAAAAGVGIGRPLAAFHLDRLVEAGLLDTEFRRRSGRSGPGAGRPAKFYLRPPGREVSVSMPPRHYDVAAEIFAEGIEREGGVAPGVLEAARERGEAMAASASGESGPPALLHVLSAEGYEPYAGSDGAIRLRNCPFHALVGEHRELTCSVNLAMLGALAEGVPDVRLEARPQPPSEDCCVAFVPAARRA